MIGDNIQFYRRKMSMSQEDLSKKLMISRQTISQWETGQTLPTVDNIIKLKEIFNVSFDSLFGNPDQHTSEQQQELKLNSVAPTYNNLPETQEQNPKEEITIENYQTILQKYIKEKNTKTFLRIISVAILLILYFSISPDLELDFLNRNSLLDISDRAFYLTIGFFVFFISTILTNLTKINKLKKRKKQPITPKQIVYKAYQNYFTANILHDGDQIKCFKVYYSDVTNVKEINKYLVLETDEQNYLLPKINNPGNSEFYTKLETLKKTKKTLPIGIVLILSCFFSILSIAGLFAGLILSGLTSLQPQDSFKELWLSVLFLPLPISAILFGIRFKKHLSAKICFVIGVFFSIFMCLLCLIPFFEFLGTDHNVNSTEIVETIGGVKIPEDAEISVKDFTKSFGIMLLKNGKGRREGKIGLSKSDAAIIAEELKKDPHWVQSHPESFNGILSSSCRIYNGDYFLLYDYYNGNYNTLPTLSGNYHMLNIVFSQMNQMIYFIEYDIRYVQ